MPGSGLDPTSGRVHDGFDQLVQALPPGGHHVTILAEQLVDDWYRRVGKTAQPPDSHHFISVGDAVRGAAATETRQFPGREMAITTVERPLDPDPFVETVADALDEQSVVILGDVSFLFEDAADPEAVLGQVIDLADEADAPIHAVRPTASDAATALGRRLDPADESTAEALIDEGLGHLRRTDPTNHGYLRSNWREARRGIELVDMSYPQARQVHDALPDPDTTPRTLGAALGALVKLGVIDVWGDTIAANRYDLTGYDPERMAIVADRLSEDKTEAEAGPAIEAD